MNKKILIVGGVAGGASAAARLRRNSEKDKIIMFEKGPHVSFSNCALPYHLSGTIEAPNRLVLMSPEKFKAQYNIEARVNSEVVSIDRQNKEIEVKNILTGEVYREKYDKLILSPGARPIVPNIPGIENVNVFTIRNVIDIDKLNRFIKEIEVKDVAVIGGGNVAMDSARTIKKLGADKVYVIYRRSEEQMPAEKKEIQAAKNDGIEFKIELNL